MKVGEIEAVAEEVLEAFEIDTLPVDPYSIARLEGITLLPGDYDGCFDGRIEYRRDRHGVAGFFLLYAAESSSRLGSRVRFTVAHELGHFYVPPHRERLLSGKWHGSQVGFLSDEETEHQADLFAAALLMPRRHFHDIVSLKTGGVCSLDELRALATDTFETSLTATVIRYVQLDQEPCCVVVSLDGVVRYSIVSETLRAMGMNWIAPRSRVPRESVTGRLVGASGQATADRQGSVPSYAWFNAGPGNLWEEVQSLGQYGTMTFLALDEDSVE